MILIHVSNMVFMTWGDIEDANWSCYCIVCWDGSNKSILSTVLSLHHNNSAVLTVMTSLSSHIHHCTEEVGVSMLHLYFTTFKIIKLLFQCNTTIHTNSNSDNDFECGKFQLCIINKTITMRINPFIWREWKTWPTQQLAGNSRWH